MEKKNIAQSVKTGGNASMNIMMRGFDMSKSEEGGKMIECEECNFNCDTCMDEPDECIEQYIPKERLDGEE